MLTSVEVCVDKAFDKATKVFGETTFFKQFGGIIPLSTDKVNILVGPSGSGKSSFLTLLAAYSFCLMHSSSCPNVSENCSEMSKYAGRDPSNSYSFEEVFLRGISVEGTIGNAVYYRPGYMYGLEPDIAHAMCMGYSSLSHALPPLYKYSAGEYAKYWLSELPEKVKRSMSPREVPKHAHESKRVHASVKRWNKLFDPTQKSLILLDEPETSLDAKQQLALWHSMLEFQSQGHQVVVATHQFLPFLNHPSFNVIDIEPGYAHEAASLLATWL
jgi:hypothetical protein